MTRPLLALLLLLLAAPRPAAAAESAAIVTPQATATLISDRDAASAGRPLHLALRLRLAPGWHVYWRNPGNAGTPTTLDLALPSGIAAGPILWPTPERLTDFGLASFAYRGDVVLPVAVTPGPDGLAAGAHATWLVCKDICIPQSADLRLALPAGDSKTPSPASPEATLISAALAAVPRASPFDAVVTPDAHLRITGDGLSRATVARATFLPDDPSAIDAAPPPPARIGTGQIDLALPRGQAFDPRAALAGTLVLTDPAGGVSDLAIRALPGPAAPPPAGYAAPGDATTGRGLAEAIGLALLGGLLLNLMPCVFPILAMKAVALAGLAGADRRRVRRDAALYTTGVLATFAALGGLLLAARATGAAAGWGFQFQSPIFVAAMAWLMLAIGLNLSGVYTVGGRLAGAGQGMASRGGAAGSLLTGVLAVVVATPCTAPFMAAAIASAMAAPAPVALGVFLALGLGLAAPTALLAASPGLARLLPRPGPWMVFLRQALAFPMYAAAAWLLWVITLQVGPPGVLATAAGLVLVGFALWLAGRLQSARAAGIPRRGHRVAAAVAAIALLAPLAGLPGLAVAPTGATLGVSPALTGEAGVEAFTPGRLADLRAEGRPVFVDMTAAWCVTCLVNERLALAPAAVRDAFTRHRVAYLRGDWTRQDPAITAFLRRYGRDGVPLYVYFPAHGDGVVLPQILTRATVLAELGAGPAAD